MQQIKQIIFSLALVAISVITGINAVHAQESVRTIQQAVTLKNLKNWTANGNVIPVCWETVGYNREKTIVREAIGATWEKFSNISFTGWTACPGGGIGG